MAKDQPVPIEGEYLERSTGTLLEDFGAGNAAPGSGSAAALMGLLSVKLIQTVCLKSLEKTDAGLDFDALGLLLEQTKPIEENLKVLFERDAKDFAEVVVLRKRRDKAVGQAAKAKYSRRANDLLEKATDHAFEIARNCMRLIDHGVTSFDAGWHAVRGDAGAAISSAIAGVSSVIFIVNLNLKTLKDRVYAKENVKTAEELKARLLLVQNEALSRITSIEKEALSALQIELPVT